MKAFFVAILTWGTLIGHGHAFSLLGPFESWMQPTNGNRQGIDIGGPVNLGEEYRWNVPVLTYSFDASFVDYFGSNGVAAVEAAIQILNELPPASQLNPNDYPLNVTGGNHVAEALELRDLKSQTLAVLLEQLGLAEPCRNIFVMRDFAFNNGNFEGQVIQRNFDPISLTASSQVNGIPYIYWPQVFTNGATIFAIAGEFGSVPNATDHPAVADGFSASGYYCTGLTGDDVGGLRYLLRTNNLNPEILLPGAHGVGTNAGAYSNFALRPGVEKVSFVRPNYDTLLGHFFVPYTNRFTDRYVTNSTVVEQQLERVVTVPDLLFSTGGTNQGYAGTPSILRTGTTNWWSSTTIPGANGPGLIRPPITLLYTKSTTTAQTSDLYPDGTGIIDKQRWGSFDGSTNLPIAYPVEASQPLDLTIRLTLVNATGIIGTASWQLPVPPAGSVVVQTSTNLLDWLPILSFASNDVVDWIHFCAHSERYFRIMPQN